MRTITNPTTGSSLASSVVRVELQTLETEVANVTTGHDHDGSNSKAITKTTIGLGNVDNTSDLNKPVSTAQQTALDLKANKAQEAWHEIGAGGQPAFGNFWSNYGGPQNTCAFMKDDFGFVHLKGLAKNSNLSNLVIFTLPVAYRPPIENIFSVTSNDSFGSIRVAATGTVTMFTGSGLWISLDGITFRLT